MPAPVAAVAAVAKKKAMMKVAKVAAVGIVVGTLGFVGIAMAFNEQAKAACGGPGAGFGPNAGLPATDANRGTFGDPDPTELARFMFAKRQLESGQNYQARYNGPGSDASGAYQYISSTWNAPAHKAIWSKYGNYPEAYLAPPAVQDEVAAYDFVSAWHTYGNWAQVAMTHYYPIWVDDPANWDRVPRPDAGNRLTLRQYAEKVLGVMNNPKDFPGGTDATSVDCRAQFDVQYVGDGTAGSKAVEKAVKYIGIGYKWGGGHPVGSQWLGMDCSGFVFNAYRDLGIEIGTYTGAQRNYGVHLGTSLSVARPGDLIFTGYLPNDDRHVIMYYGYIDGKHMVLESGGQGSECTANNPTYGTNPRCRGIGPPHEFADNRDIIEIRRYTCGLDAAGNPTPCSGSPAV